MPSEPLNKVYHVLNIPEREQAFIKEVVEDLTDTFIKGKALSAAGEAAEGILSNPNLALLVGGGILAVAAGAVGKDKIDGLVNYFGNASLVFSSEPDSDEQHQAAQGMINFLKSIVPFGFLAPEP